MRKKFNNKPEDEYVFEQVVSTRRVAKVVKGGKNFRFTATMVVGNKKGKVGFGMGKANQIVSAINKAKDRAKKDAFTFPMRNGTIPHEVKTKFGGSKVMIKPAAPGTGIIAGGPVRAMMEGAGVENVLTKSFGSNTKHNIVKATEKALKSLRSHEELAKLRGKTIAELMA
ncbi:MAG: 30S ribosomal protein S5 [Candidatus Cloacimonadota bacterium]|nr:30S ribosomal protein S5 [Candidatus Cloacimonadota bacterium]